MTFRRFFAIILCSLILTVFVGCNQSQKMELNLSAPNITTYKVVSQSTKDYMFVQPSVDKTKERHTVGRVEMVFNQAIESVDSKGVATASIMIKELKYFSQSPKGTDTDFDSTKEECKSDALMALIGVDYKITISPKGKVNVLDAKAARAAVKSGSAKKFADSLFSSDSIIERHQVLALADANKGLSKKGDKWSSIVASPKGMLKPKSFEKIYTVKDIKTQDDQTVATIEMKAVPSSKRAEDMPKDSGMGFFANMFEENDDYSGNMVINLTTGEIISYNETLKAEWFAAESPEDQKSDKGPDELTMGFSSLYSIEKIQ